MGHHINKALAGRWGSWIPAYAGMTDLFSPPLSLPRIRRQQTRQPLVQFKQEGDAFGVRFVGSVMLANTPCAMELSVAYRDPFFRSAQVTLSPNHPNPSMSLECEHARLHIVHLL
jgi:hypothetical protein